jgi:serine/threonine protein kinase
MDQEREGFPITALREVKVLQQLSHPHVVQLKDVVTDTPGLSHRATFFLVCDCVCVSVSVWVDGWLGGF